MPGAHTDEDLVRIHISMLQKHEDEINRQKDKLEAHEVMFAELTVNVKKMVTSMASIKWAFIGGLVVFFIKELGIAKLIEILITRG